MIKLLTIGHSNQRLDDFIRLLEQHGVMTLVDVRSAPYSRYNPQFNKETLARALQARDIQYAYAGKFLGGRPADPNCYKSRHLPKESADYLHEVDYPEVMKRDWFLKGIARLLEMADEQTTAIMCSEEDPSRCHRHHLIVRYLMTHYPDVKVLHIRSDGTVYNAATIIETVDEPAGEQLSLF